MATEAIGAVPWSAGCQIRRKSCVPVVGQHYADVVERRLRVLKVTAWMSAALIGAWSIVQFATMPQEWRVGLVDVVTAVVFAMIPLLNRFGELVGPLVFVVSAYASIFAVCWSVGTASGLQFYFLVAAATMLLVLGIERIFLASVLAGIGAALTITLEFLVPADRGIEPQWALSGGFAISIISACGMVLAIVWYALRSIERAEAAMESEYQRSESLLANILPATVAARLKDPSRTVIADKYDDASILFADIADYTKRASDTTPAELVRFLDRLYTEFDRLVDTHGLEKIKTSGDSYMVVSGVPLPRPDHLQALAGFALDMADVVAGLTDPQGRPVRLRIGMGAGPVVAGVVGARRFFYDVWGDAVNIASRMESTDTEGRIQVPQDIYERLKDDFVLEPRGDVDVKGKGVMRTWYLVGRRCAETDPQTLAGASSCSSADVT